VSRTKSNKGEVGVKSIRIAGMKFDDLPIAESALAKQQLPEAEKNEKENQIANIKARYPTQNVNYLIGRIREARGMIARFQQERNRIGHDRLQYKVLLSDAEKRDIEIEDLKQQDLGEEDFNAKVRELNKRYGPWQVKGLSDQILQFEDSIRRFDETIQREQEVIDELSELLGECRARDKELSRLGA
jgi:hypothetical protein